MRDRFRLQISIRTKSQGTWLKQLPVFGKSDDFRHSRAGGKPVVRGILGSRLRGNDEVANRAVNPGLILRMEHLVPAAPTHAGWPTRKKNNAGESENSDKLNALDQCAVYSGSRFPHHQRTRHSFGLLGRFLSMVDRRFRCGRTASIVGLWLFLMMAGPPSGLAQRKKTEDDTPQPASVAPRDVRSRNFLLHTDLNDKDAEDLLERLETMLRLISKYWDQPNRKTIECYVVKDLNNWPPNSIDPVGLASIQGKAGVTATRVRSLGRQFDAKSIVYAYANRGTPQHEAVHAYCGQTFGRTGPLWYSEGMAEMGNYWKEGDASVNCGDYVVRYIHSTPPKTLNAIVNSKEVTDAGLEHLKGLTSLLTLDLNNTKVTDAGVVYFKGMTSLQTLWLNNTKVADSGLEHLKGLTSLLTLYLNDAQVTGTGLEHLKELSSLQTMLLNNTKVTDAGLEHLKGLTSLQALLLNNTKVTDAGLVHLKELTSLQTLDLRGTSVTTTGVAVLQSALPKCKIYE
jgi:hypothetical protein